MKKIKKILPIILFFLIGAIIYLIGYIQSGTKFAPPHFHANFALYINDTRIDFSDPEYSEDVAGCKIGNTLYPENRAHLHENNPDTIHIHDHGVAWGHFFLNNNFYLSKKTFINDQGEIFKNSQGKNIYFILNGKQVKNPFNRLITSEDRLLAYHGEKSLEIVEQEIFPNVSKNAGEYNNKYDPGTCGGNSENSKKAVIMDLLHNIFGVDSH